MPLNKWVSRKNFACLTRKAMDEENRLLVIDELVEFEN